MCHEAADFFEIKNEFDEPNYKKEGAANGLVGCFRDTNTEIIHFNDKNLGSNDVNAHFDQHVCMLKESNFIAKL